MELAFHCCHPERVEGSLSLLQSALKLLRASPAFQFLLAREPGYWKSRQLPSGEKG